VQRADSLRIGIDLDNTIVSYEETFAASARRRGLIEAHRRPSRIALRDELRQSGREDIWTELQGEVYGTQMHAAPVFAGALQFVDDCLQAGAAVFIVSHRTRQPYRGEPADLHAAARRWLESKGFIGSTRLSPEQVFLELTREEKLRRIDALHCTHFIDDLPELLSDRQFPRQTLPILFDPDDSAGASPLLRLRSWTAASALILRERETR
jgi:hypothetical protein